MADIINFQKYISSKEEEKERIKRVSVLSTRSKNIEGLLHDIDSSIGCSLTTRHFGEMNQIVAKDNIIDHDMLNVILNSLNNYYNAICERINELNGCGVGSIIY